MPVLHKILWGLNITLEIGVPFLMVWKKQHRAFPAVFAYLVLNLSQAAAIYVAYRWKGYVSWPAFWTYWISQAIVVVARWAAVCELCLVILGQFKGIWALTWRVLALIGGGSLLFAVGLGGHDFLKLVTTFDLGLEMSMAMVLVVFFSFARYYKIAIQNPLRSMGIAFCLYSLFRALNDSVLQIFLRRYTATWSLVDEVTYLATLILIGSATYVLGSEASRKVVLLPRAAYSELAPQISNRLQLLNMRLDEILRSKQAGKT
ncbi:MAG TPA: hypothetical protein VKD70_05545 [Candidatus Acidoferrum sp.]|nr:hypothetical protein [Candidatus Acidoferrum sp.]